MRFIPAVNQAMTLISPWTVAKEHPSIWLHVDAAWAGVTLACPEYRGRAQLDGINKWATSLCVNFHKVSVIQLRLQSTDGSLTVV